MTTHTNGQFGPPELKGGFFDVGETHEHICFDHAVEEENRIRSGGVQTARKIDPDFDSFQEALKYVCVRLNVENFADIPVPNIQGVLF
jgi:hypothetical protein